VVVGGLRAGGRRAAHQGQRPRQILSGVSVALIAVNVLIYVYEFFLWFDPATPAILRSADASTTSSSSSSG
jgi:hypothetical protein